MIQGYQDGQTRDIGGTTYVRQGGQWTPQGGTGTAPQGQPSVPQPVIPRPTPQPPAWTPPAGYRGTPEALEPIPGGPNDPAARPTAQQRPLTAVQQQGLRGRYDSLQGLETVIDQLETLYDENLAGDERGGIFGFGGDRNLRGRLPLAPTGYGNFDATAGRLIDQIIQTFDITGGEANSVAELRARFGPYLPSSTDSDETIQGKLTELRGILQRQRATIGRELGVQEAAPSTPVSTPPGERMTTAPRPVTATGSEAKYGLSRDGTVADESQLSLSRQLHQEIDRRVRGGSSDADIRAFARENGIEIDEVLRFRRTPEYQRWRHDHPNQMIPWRDENLNRPMTGAESLLHNVASSAPGTAIAHSANSMTAGLVPGIVDLAGGDGDRLRWGLQASAEENPGAALIGNLAGSTLAYGAGGRIASAFGRTALGSRLPASLTQAPGQYTMLAPRAVTGDTIYGAAQGWGENGDPLSGIIENNVGGMVGRGAPRAFASAVSPTGGAMSDLYEAGVRPTIGQRFRGTGWPGDAVNAIEEVSQSFPIVGRLPQASRQAARDEWERGAWNRSLENLRDDTGQPLRLPDDTRLGPNAHQYAQGAFDDAYDNVRGRLSFVADQDWANDLAQIRQDAQLLSPGIRRRFNDVVDDTIERRITNGGGTLSGDGFKAAASDLGSEIRRIRRLKEPTQAQLELLGTLEELDSALHQGARRSSPPDVIEELDRVDRGYAMLTRIEGASRRRPLQVGRFTPSDMLQTEAREGGIRGRRFSRGDGLFTEYAEQGRNLEDILPSSGTSERGAGMNLLAQYGPGAAVAGAGTGAYALGIDPDTIGYGVAGVLAPHFPGARSLVRRGMAPRKRTSTLAEFVRGNLPRHTGRAGAAMTAYGVGEDEDLLGGY